MSWRICGFATTRQLSAIPRFWCRRNPRDASRGIWPGDEKVCHAVVAGSKLLPGEGGRELKSRDHTEHLCQGQRLCRYSQVRILLFFNPTSRGQRLYSFLKSPICSFLNELQGVRDCRYSQIRILIFFFKSNLVFFNLTSRGQRLWRYRQVRIL